MANNWLDTQHRAYAAHSAQTAENSSCDQLVRGISHADRSTENTSTTFFDCKISMDWVEQIENALPYIENALSENRQFILKQGDIVPIEKAKRVSKASVEHLARHSELITKVPEQGDEVIPDKLYITENVGTYAVYENRFLYMLLCYLRDFVNYRYKRIKELVASFATNIEYSKQYKDDTRQVSFQLTFSESSIGLPGVAAGNTEAVLDRIYTILQTVEQLLKTDLMKEVSDAPMLHPPIARTNVLLHDPNFRVAFELYSFVSAYAHDGFEQIERYTASGRMPEQMRHDFAVLVGIASYLSYRNGGLLEELEKRYLEDQVAAAKREEAVKKARIIDLKHRIGDLSDEAAQYILELEKWAGELESKTAMLYEVEQLRKDAEKQLQTVHSKISPLQTQIIQLQTREEELLAQAERNTAALKQAEEHMLHENAQREALQQKHAMEMQQQKESFVREFTALTEKYDLLRGMELASQAKDGISESYVSKEAFSELEAQYKAFRSFYEKQWALAKKQIRKDSMRK